MLFFCLVVQSCLICICVQSIYSVVVHLSMNHCTCECPSLFHRNINNDWMRYIEQKKVGILSAKTRHISITRYRGTFSCKRHILNLNSEQCHAWLIKWDCINGKLWKDEPSKYSDRFTMLSILSNSTNRCKCILWFNEIFMARFVTWNINENNNSLYYTISLYMYIVQHMSKKMFSR
jgi:hypothetical protein